MDMPGAITAGQFVAGYVGASGVAFVDASEMAYAGILAATGGHWSRDPYMGREG